MVDEWDDAAHVIKRLEDLIEAVFSLRDVTEDILDLMQTERLERLAIKPEVRQEPNQ